MIRAGEERVAGRGDRLGFLHIPAVCLLALRRCTHLPRLCMYACSPDVFLCAYDECVRSMDGWMSRADAGVTWGSKGDHHQRRAPPEEAAPGYRDRRARSR